MLERGMRQHGSLSKALQSRPQELLSYLSRNFPLLTESVGSYLTLELMYQPRFVVQSWDHKFPSRQEGIRWSAVGLKGTVTGSHIHLDHSFLAQVEVYLEMDPVNRWSALMEWNSKELYPGCNVTWYEEKHQVAEPQAFVQQPGSVETLVRQVAYLPKWLTAPDGLCKELEFGLVALAKSKKQEEDGPGGDSFSWDL